MRKKSFYEILGITNCSDISSVKEAFSALIDILNEETVTYSLYDEKDKVYLSSTIKFARDILTDPLCKKLYDEYLIKARKARVYIPFDKKDNEKNERLSKKMSPGERIKKTRIEKNISLEEVLINTRISIEKIKAIESEDYNNLPDEVYLKGLLKQYLKFLGLEESNISKEYLNKFKQYRVGNY